MGAASVTCPQCGMQASGKFCSECGAPLDAQAESLGREVKSKFTGPLVAALSFLKPMWLLLRHPQTFCAAYFGGPKSLASVPFPLSGLWRVVSSGPQAIAGPFASLATAVGLLALVGGADTMAWRLAGLEETRQTLEEQTQQGLQQTEQQAFGQELRQIDMEHLTGFGLLDAALGEVWHLFHYLLFALLVALFIPRRAVARADLINYFVYGMSAALLLYALIGLLGALLILSLAGESIYGALYAQGFVQEVLGHLPKIYFLVVLPIVLFPKVLPVSRARVVLAMLPGAVVWMGVNALLTGAQLFTGVIAG